MITQKLHLSVESINLKLSQWKKHILLFTANGYIIKESSDMKPIQDLESNITEVFYDCVCEVKAMNDKIIYGMLKTKPIYASSLTVRINPSPAAKNIIPNMPYIMSAFISFVLLFVELTKRTLP